jgi:hypothetical protein
MATLRRVVSMAAMLALVISFVSAVPARAQERLSDKDLEQRIKNMNDDVKKFRSMFNSAMGKTNIGKTSQEKDAKALVQDFQGSTSSLYDKFKSTKKSDPYLQNCLDTMPKIDDVLHSAHFDPTPWRSGPKSNRS